VRTPGACSWEMTRSRGTEAPGRVFQEHRVFLVLALVAREPGRKLGKRDSASDNKYVSGSVRFALFTYMALRQMWPGSEVPRILGKPVFGRSGGGPRRKHLNVMQHRRLDSVSGSGRYRRSRSGVQSGSFGVRYWLTLTGGFWGWRAGPDSPERFSCEACGNGNPERWNGRQDRAESKKASAIGCTPSRFLEGGFPDLGNRVTPSKSSPRSLSSDTGSRGREKVSGFGSVQFLGRSEAPRFAHRSREEVVQGQLLRGFVPVHFG